MSTKAQDFKAEQMREAHPPRPKRPRRPRRDDPVDTSLPGVSATDRNGGAVHTGLRNISNRAAARGGAKLEDSATGKPSRKSTRKSSGRIKRASNLQRRAMRKATSSKTKATNARAKKR